MTTKNIEESLNQDLSVQIQSFDQAQQKSEILTESIHAQKSESALLITTIQGMESTLEELKVQVSKSFQNTDALRVNISCKISFNIYAFIYLFFNYNVSFGEFTSSFDLSKEGNIR